MGGDNRLTNGHQSAFLHATESASFREHGFDDFAEAQCAIYAETMAGPVCRPASIFRLLLIGYFEGIDSERGIACHAADSLALRDFLVSTSKRIHRTTRPFRTPDG